MSGQQVSAEYLEGLRDGRRALKDCTTPEEARRAAAADLRFCDRIAHCAYSETQEAYLRGLRDFWTHQQRKR